VTAYARLERRGFSMRGLAATSTTLLGGCEELSNQDWVRRILDSGETLTRTAQRALITPQALAREYSEADLSSDFKANGSTNPDDPAYVAPAENGFAARRGARGVENMRRPISGATSSRTSRPTPTIPPMSPMPKTASPTGSSTSAAWSN